MKFIGNIIFIIGGMLGIGCVFVENLYCCGNKVIVVGCCKVLFDEIVCVNLGIDIVELDVGDV